MITSIFPNDALRLVMSTHTKPHKVLGMHKITWQEKEIIAVRAFFPGASGIFVLDTKSKEEYPMERVHPEGLFEAVFFKRDKKFSYRLKVIDRFHQTNYVDDPYQFQGELNVTALDKYLFSKSVHYKIYDKIGAQLRCIDGVSGAFFTLWAPNARRISVIGDFNQWDGRKNPMKFDRDSGMWEIFIPGLKQGEKYKYEIKSKSRELLLKSDPYAFYSEVRPQTASIIYNLNSYDWKDQAWMKKRREGNFLKQPISVYEVHMGSWQRIIEEENRFMSYREYADRLIPYVKEMGYTHIELLPVLEHPLDDSWGYQVTGYFAPTSRFGEPSDFMYFIDQCHQNGIGVILDWVPAHFPKDMHGLNKFDGTHLYEHADPRQGEQPDWGTKIFNFSRLEVKNFLISNAMFWVDKYHLDGLRVDAVAAMIYLDFSKKEGEWIPNEYGGNENLQAIEFMKHMNAKIHEFFPGVLMIAEESTSFSGVSRPTYLGGLGFGFKWNMGWMHDVLLYMSKDPIHRKYHHNKLTFGLLYAFSENFILPFSHDEVVHGKQSMINKMPGDYWQKFANLRLLYTFQYGHPGKKHLFMGQEFGQFKEWKCKQSLDWNLLDYDYHRNLQTMLKDLNRLYRKETAFWEDDFTSQGFEWLNPNDSDNCVLSFLRRGEKPDDILIFVLNFTPVPRNYYVIGVPKNGFYKEIFNSDSESYGGSNVGNAGGIQAQERETLGRPFSLSLMLPPLGGIILKPRCE